MFICVWGFDSFVHLLSGLFNFVWIFSAGSDLGCDGGASFICVWGFDSSVHLLSGLLNFVGVCG